MQAGLLNLHHLHCPAWLFSGQGELQCSNRAASGKGKALFGFGRRPLSSETVGAYAYFELTRLLSAGYGRTLESLLVQLGFAEPLSDLDTHASCR